MMADRSSGGQRGDHSRAEEDGDGCECGHWAREKGHDDGDRRDQEAFARKKKR